MEHILVREDKLHVIVDAENIWFVRIWHDVVFVWIPVVFDTTGMCRISNHKSYF